MALVTEDRKNLSLVMTSSVAHNITLAALGQYMKAGVIRRQPERAAVHEAIDELRIKTPGPDVNVSTLSGGNQQKVVLAKCLLTKPRVLLLDEPTRGIDVGAKAELYTLIGQIAQTGTAVVMASSELPELLAICDRILVLSDGELVEELTQAEATEENIMEAATGRIGHARSVRPSEAQTMTTPATAASTQGTSTQRAAARAIWVASPFVIRAGSSCSSCWLWPPWPRPSETGPSSSCNRRTCSTSSASRPSTASSPSA